MDPPVIERQNGFDNGEVTLIEVEIIEQTYRNVPFLEKSKSEELNTKSLKVVRSYSF